MPTLQVRNDGGYYIRNFYHDHHTWQASAAGVQWLERRGIKPGAFFDTSVFMYLYMHGWVYTGSSPSKTAPPRRLAAVIPELLLSSVRALHSAVVAKRSSDVLEHVSPLGGEKESDLRVQVEGGVGVRRWTPKDAVLFAVDQASSVGLGGVQEAALVTMRLIYEGGEKIVEQTWVRDDAWKLVWDSFGARPR